LKIRGLKDRQLYDVLMKLPKSLLILFLTLLTGISQAQPITFIYKVKVTGFSDANNLTEGSIHIGDIIEGEYTFDSTTPNTITPPYGGALYVNTGSPFGFSMKLGKHQLQSNPNPPVSIPTIKTYLVNSIIDFYQVTSNSNLLDSSLLDVSNFVFFLENPLGYAFDSDALPLNPLDLTKFNGRNNFQFNGGGLIIMGVPTSLTKKETSTLAISPPSGKYSLNQSFTPEFLLEFNGSTNNTVLSKTILWNGLDVTSNYSKYLISGSILNPTGNVIGLSYRLPLIHLNSIKPGNNTITIKVTLGDGTVLKQTAKWNILNVIESTK
jgi:hypothetical protein